MAISNYNQLITAIVDWAPEISSTDPIADFIALAEAEYFPLIKHYAGEKTTTINTNSNQVTVPADCNEFRRIRIDGANAVPVSVYGGRLKEGQTGYLRSGNTISFAPTFTATRAIELTYYARPPALSPTATTNWLLTKYPQFYLWASLAQGYAWRGNEIDETKAKAKADETFAKMVADHNASMNSGNSIVIDMGGFSFGD
jgi:hypothetical protein